MHMKLSLCILSLLLLSTIARPAAPAYIFSEKAVVFEGPKTSSKDQLRVAQMKWFVSLTVPGYEKLKGKKINFLEKFSFKLSQKRMKKMIKLYDDGEVTTLEKISWLLKGLVLGPIAVLLAYIIFKEDKRELIKWTWFGFAGWAVLLAVILLVI